jgi:hypothetical protein
MRRRPLLVSLPGLLAAASPSWAQRSAGMGSGTRVLRLAFATPETSFDPPQTNSDQNSSVLISQILEAPLCFDYLARPATLRPNTAVALPEVSENHTRLIVTLKPFDERTTPALGVNGIIAAMAAIGVGIVLTRDIFNLFVFFELIVIATGGSEAISFAFNAPTMRGSRCEPPQIGIRPQRA